MKKKSNVEKYFEINKKLDELSDPAFYIQNKDDERRVLVKELNDLWQKMTDKEHLEIKTEYDRSI